VSGDARELPSFEFLMNPSPRSIGEGGGAEFLVGSFLKELPSDLGFVLVRGKKTLVGFEPRNTKESATFLISEDVLRERVLVPGFPEVSRASRASKENGDLSRPSFGLVIFELSNPQSGSGRSEVDASEFEVKMEPTFEVVKIFRGNPLARTRSKKAVSSGFGSEDFRGGGDELPEET
jgi:hypothetical protein